MPSEDADIIESAGASRNLTGMASLSGCHIRSGRIRGAALMLGAVCAAQGLAAQTAGAPDDYAAFLQSPGAVRFVVDNLWILIAAALVFVMHLGFATLESGLTRSKNTVNILFKNTFIVCAGGLTYALWGFKAMYPGHFNGFIAPGGPIPESFAPAQVAAHMTAVYGTHTYWAAFIFQAMFAATAATIVSGAVAERVSLRGFLAYATLLVMFVYPITGSWKWGGGWLNGGLDRLLGNGDGSHAFIDFAGSTLVHAFGGCAALAAVLVLGPRRGKYLTGGRIRPILGHSMPLATIGTLLLFAGWFGFNGGSVGSADPQALSRVFVVTALGGFAGGLAATFVSWGVLHKPDHSMALNGMLAGLVGITGGAGYFGPWAAVGVGAVAGALVVLSVVLFDKLKIDDPVGAISVHGVCGAWGTLAVGIVGPAHFASQLVGVLAVSAFAFVASYLLFQGVRLTLGVHVGPDEESAGLDQGEHGQEAYPGFSPASRG